MDSWRDQGSNFTHDVTRTRPNCYRKPPLGGSSSWHQSVPSWEKKFCASVGSVPWKKLVETKKFIHLYDNIIKWNDSAGQEAFENAKNNFYANMYNLPCNNSIPDPDIYIDKINWDSEVDPNLILELESDSVVPDSNSKDDEHVVIFGSSFPPSYQNFSPYGWGDSDDDNKKKDLHQREVEGNEGGVVDNNDKWWGWNDNNNYYYSEVRNECKEGNTRYMSRYKTSRFRKDVIQGGRSRRNDGNGRKSGYSCAPVNSSSHGAVAHRWSVKKQVS